MAGVIPFVRRYMRRLDVPVAPTGLQFVGLAKPVNPNIGDLFVDAITHTNYVWTGRDWAILAAAWGS